MDDSALQAVAERYDSVLDMVIVKDAFDNPRKRNYLDTRWYLRPAWSTTLSTASSARPLRLFLGRSQAQGLSARRTITLQWHAVSVK
jgi:hypothetical protein